MRRVKPTQDTLRLIETAMAGQVMTNVFVRWDFKDRAWVETRYTPRRGWWSVLWPWPEPVAILSLSGEEIPLRQGCGLTLPVYCRTKQEAADWAWCLADQKYLEVA
jgi:hypothetical protein